MRKNFFECLVLLLLGFSLSVQPLRASPMPDSGDASGRAEAPEFPKKLKWLNSTQPYSLKELRGKIVLLDFWTYCCINCIHVLPDLHALELKYGEKLVILGIHSAKFSAEQADSKIRLAVQRFHIEHPVLNDYNSDVWDLYGVQSWPTLILIDREGRRVETLSGEGHLQDLEDAIDSLLSEKAPVQTLAQPKMMEMGLPKAGLAFPSKVLLDEERQRLFVADSGHDRVLIFSLPAGQFLQNIGSGLGGLEDGNFQTARFQNPQGLALSQDGKRLYVADTGNHALRLVDLASETVTTLAGNGAEAIAFSEGGLGPKVELNSPWDLWLGPKDEALYIAMAGAHQIWREDLKSGMLRPWAGSGEEDLKDGPVEEACLAQTSGLSGDKTTLYFADPESSSVRQIDFASQEPQVKTLIGKGLFAFGDQSGPFEESRLQHPLAVALGGDYLYVADSFNDRIKRLDLKRRVSEDFAGEGKEGDRDGAGSSARFDEPGGLSLGKDFLYVADTNNHQIRVVDLKSGAVSTLKLQGIPEAP